MARLRTPGCTTAVREYLSMLTILLNLAVDTTTPSAIGAARNDLDFQVMAGLENGDDLRFVLRQYDDHGQLAIGGKAITLVGTGVLFIEQHAMRRHHRFQRGNHLALTRRRK